MKKITSLLLLIGLLFVSGLHAQTYRYEPDQVSLYGTLVSMPGETADGKKYMYPAIQLFTPISVQAQDEYSPYVGGVLGKVCCQSSVNLGCCTMPDRTWLPIWV